MQQIDFEKTQETLESLDLGLGYLEIFFIYFLSDKEEDLIRTGEILGFFRDKIFE